MKVKRWILFNFFPHIYLFLIFWGFILRLHFSTGAQRISWAEDFFLLSRGGLEQVLFVIAFNLILRRVLKKEFVASLLAFVYGVLSLYHLRAHGFMDFSLLLSNFALVKHAESWQVIGGMFKAKDWISLVVIGAIPLLFLFRKAKSELQRGIPKYYSLFSFFIVLIIFTPFSFNEFSHFATSVYRNFVPEKLPFSPSESEKKAYLSSLIRTEQFGSDKGQVLDVQRVFLIYLESYNANYLNKKNGAGKEYTPFFNKLVKEGVYFSNYYGSSMQTAKGQFASLCGRVSHSRKKVMVDVPHVKLNCLPEHMKELGFKTRFFRSFSDLSFDNTGPFWQEHGFDEVLAMNSRFISKEERQKYAWGWGIQDDLLYKKVMNYLDEQGKNEKSFSAFGPLSNHMKFRGAPAHLHFMHKNPKHIKERFGNTIYLMDLFLKTFFEELKNRGWDRDSLVILQGDHGYPMGEHGNYAPENGIFNENFKVPLLFLHPSLAPRVIEQTGSQIDFPLTLLSLLKAKGSLEHSYQGQSLWKLQGEGSAYLVQPYDGRYLGYIKGHKKYSYHVSSRRRAYYDLSKDPLEQNKSEASDEEWLDAENHFKQILLNDAMLDSHH